MSTEATAGAIYKRLLTYLGPQKWYFLLSIIGFAMFAASAPALAHLMGVVEETLNDPTQENIFLLVSALFAVYLFVVSVPFLVSILRPWLGVKLCMHCVPNCSYAASAQPIL